MNTPAAAIREYLAFADSADLELIQCAADDARALYRDAINEPRYLVFADEIRAAHDYTRGALMAAYNKLSIARKVNQ